MKNTHTSHRHDPRLRRLLATLAVALMFSAAGNILGADTAHKIPTPVEGGISPTPDIVHHGLSNGQIHLQWNGFEGPYTVEGRPGIGVGSWTTLVTTNGNSATVNPGDSTILRVKGANPLFGSANTCAQCHEETHANWSQTIHANAINSLKAIGQGNNAACLKCHTVGFGTPTGFISEAVTPNFAGVQCENCHGPSGRHAANPDALELRPIVTDSSKLCGGCHNGFHHPTYDEWSGAGHAHVTPTVANYFRDAATGTARQQACGSCHGGATRMAMMRSVKTGTLNLPDAETAATTAITCAVCHDSHMPNLDNSHSLRNPRHSTAFYSYSTATNTNFKAQWDAGGKDIQICGQCHNSRGANPNDTSRPPHHSPQYNILIGDVGVSAGYVAAAAPSQQSAHRNIQNQCTRCHTHGHEPDVASEQDPVYTGHGFEPSIESCVECHQTEQKAEEIIASTQTNIKGLIAEVKGLLDTWAATKAPEALRTKYGALAWEYNTSGQLSNPTGSATIKGPTGAEQADVPADIKKARYYLYMVEHDGSYGVHNAKYARYLLGTAKTNVQTRLAQ